MWRTNLKILALLVVMLGGFMMVANTIPQIQSEVPAALDLSGEVTPEALVAAGGQIYNGAGGCTACHGLGTRAPNLLTDEGGTGTIGARCGSRKPGMACKDYLFESLTDPNTFVVEGYQPIMPDMRRTLPADQVWAVIAYLESLGGTVTVTPDEVRAAQQQAGGESGGGGGGGGAGPVTASLDPREIMTANACVGCHVLDGQGAPVGPPFDGIGRRLTRDQIRTAILDPNAGVSPGFEAMAGMMPATFGQQLSGAQLEAVVTFLASRR